jgi:7-carboxy-7-deazaguanine synthase
MYAVKEIFKTLQGEGFHTGRAAVFCRFAGCNLWTGREEDRRAAVCKFCDTDFIGTDGKNGGKYDARSLAKKCLEVWLDDLLFDHDHHIFERFIVLTGGEPLLQVDEDMLHQLKIHGFKIAVETNGSVPAPNGIDWLTVSPKEGAHFVQNRGNELKLIYPQTGVRPRQFEDMRFDHFYLQPMDGPLLKENTALAVQQCLYRPQWRLSLQTQKMIGIP